MGKMMFAGYVLILGYDVGVVFVSIQTVAEFWEQYLHDSTLDEDNFLVYTLPTSQVVCNGLKTSTYNR